MSLMTLPAIHHAAFTWAKLMCKTPNETRARGMFTLATTSFHEIHSNGIRFEKKITKWLYWYVRVHEARST